MFRKSVDGILRQFTSAVSDLRVLADQQLDVALTCEADANRLIEQSHEARAESMRANNIAGRISNLID